MSDSSGPTVSVAFNTYAKLQDDLKAFQNRIYELEKAVTEAQLTDKAGIVQQLHKAFHEAIKVVQFAVGNLDPQTVAGWPHAALAKIADAIEQLPGIDRHVSEMPEELRAFARLAASYEEFRKARDANRVVVAASASDFGPQTPEAKAVHEAYAARISATQNSDETDTVVDKKSP